MIKKIFLVIGIIFVLLILCVVLFCLMILSTNLPKGNHEEVLKSDGQPIGKALIIYQPSISNISSRMAHQIAKGLNDSGYEVTMNYPGKKLTYDISSYQVVIFGSPAYWSNSSKALIDYIKSIKDYSLGKVVLYSTGIAMNSMDEFDGMEKSLKDVKPYKVFKFDTNLKKEENENTAYELGKELSKND